MPRPKKQVSVLDALDLLAKYRKARSYDPKLSISAYLQSLPEPIDYGSFQKTVAYLDDLYRTKLLNPASGSSGQNAFTKEGARILDRVEVCIKRMTSRPGHQSRPNRLRVGTYNVFAVFVLPDRLKRYFEKREHANVLVGIREVDSVPWGLQRMLAGRLDCLLTGREEQASRYSNLFEFQSSGWSVGPVIIHAPGLEPVERLQDLARRRVIVVRDWQRWVGSLPPREHDGELLVVDSYASVLALARAGVGYGLFLDFIPRGSERWSELGVVCSKLRLGFDKYELGAYLPKPFRKSDHPVLGEFVDYALKLTTD
jgi:DNA-binding transcriptional LysR family regulator